MSANAANKWNFECFVCNAEFVSTNRDAACPRCGTQLHAPEISDPSWKQPLEATAESAHQKLPPDLAHLNAHWNFLAPHIREAIVTLANAALNG